MKRRTLLKASGGLGLLALYPAAQAQAFPSHLVRIVVPLTAGGLTDVSMRITAEALGARLGQQVMIDNKPGAAGAIAARGVAQSAPDGYTLLAVTSSHTSVVPYAQANAGFDPLKDFAPVGTISKSPSVLYVHPGVPVKTMAEFIAYAKANPGKLTYATAGIGSFGHVATELLCQRAGITMTMIPYQGAGQSTTALVGGEVNCQFTLPSGSFGEYVATGKLMALGLAMLEPSPLLPGVPTIAQTLPGFEAVVWTGLLAPIATPAAVVAQLNRELSAVVATQAVRDKFAQMGIEASGMTSAQYRTLVLAEQQHWEPLIRKMNIRS
ncbi:MAG: LacI family transcriptional regulator [Rhizobacter sp.]|nr:LacI family transcriptional regulator [Rhizobacter sp.]